MSLINKMLQDLDARGGNPHAAASADVRAVLHGEPRGRMHPLRAAVLLLAAAAVVAAGVAGYRYWKARSPKPAPQTQAVHPAPLAAAASGPAPQNAVVERFGPPKGSEPVRLPQAAAAPARSAPDHPAARPAAANAAPEPALPAKAVLAAAPEAAPSAPAARHEQPRKAAIPSHAEKTPAPAVEVTRDSTPEQKAESAYRRANAALEEGRVSEAIILLNQALEAAPRHDASRQLLIGLLVEQHRTDEAMRQLTLALTLEPRQPSLAMLLARLQIERGGDGLEVLQRTLPYANGDAAYHAFYAGALQRAGRHADAVVQYQAAVRGPAQPAWWIGLGISLEALHRVPEAVDAFTRARAGGNLAPELDAFAERKLQQLGPHR
ncbi:MAG: tetratricopeptide repeat protein [Telluria sp.]